MKEIDVSGMNYCHTCKEFFENEDNTEKECIWCWFVRLFKNNFLVRN